AGQRAHDLPERADALLGLVRRCDVDGRVRDRCRPAHVLYLVNRADADARPVFGNHGERRRERGAEHLDHSARVALRAARAALLLLGHGPSGLRAAGDDDRRAQGVRRRQSQHQSRARQRPPAVGDVSLHHVCDLRGADAPIDSAHLVRTSARYQHQSVNVLASGLAHLVRDWLSSGRASGFDSVDAGLDVGPLTLVRGRARAPRRLRHRIAGRAAARRDAGAARRARLAARACARPNDHTDDCQQMISRVLQFQLARVLLAIGALAFACSSTRAMPLADYRARIPQGDGALAHLLKLYEAAQDDQQPATTASFRSEEADDLRALRAALPVTEKVEWAGGTVEVNNQWLQDELDAYEKLPPTPTKARVAALKRVAARLHALYERLDEVARAPVAQPRDKSAEKGRLHAILQRPEYNEAAASDSALERLWTRFMKWLRSLMPEPKPIQPGTGMLLSRPPRRLIPAPS